MSPPATLTLTCPADIRVTSPDRNPFAVTFAPETTGGLAPVTVACDPAPGVPFPLGTTPVSCSAKDTSGQTATCQFSVDVAPPPRIKYTTFMAFGDSITEGQVGVVSAFRIVDPTLAYPTKLQQLLAARYTAQTVTVVNEGKGGEFTTSAMGRLQHALATWHPQVVLLSEGTNDLNGGASRIYPAADAMEEMARKIVESGAEAIVGTVPPMREGLPKAGCPECVVPYNARVVMLTSRRGARIVDIYPLLSAHITTLIGDDGIHPTAAGYQVMAQAYFDAIVWAFDISPAETAPAEHPLHGTRH